MRLTLRDAPTLRADGYYQSATFPISDGAGDWRTITVWCSCQHCPHTDTGAHSILCEPLTQPHEKEKEEL